MFTGKDYNKLGRRKESNLDSRLIKRFLLLPPLPNVHLVKGDNF